MLAVPVVAVIVGAVVALGITRAAMLFGGEAIVYAWLYAGYRLVMRP
jgi:hypothetical protein